MANDIGDGEEGGVEDWSVEESVLEDEEAAPELTPDQLQKALAPQPPSPPLDPMLLLHLPSLKRGVQFCTATLQGLARSTAEIAVALAAFTL